MPEFVNPKYADASKNSFKSPTRLECMMQVCVPLLSAAPSPHLPLLFPPLQDDLPMQRKLSTQPSYRTTPPP